MLKALAKAIYILAETPGRECRLHHRLAERDRDSPTMELATLIPAVLCIIVIARSGTTVALWKVFLPVLLLVPTYFAWNFRPLPPINR